MGTRGARPPHRAQTLSPPRNHSPPVWLEHDLGSADPFASQPCSLSPILAQFGHETNQDGVLTAPLVFCALPWPRTHAVREQPASRLIAGGRRDSDQVLAGGFITMLVDSNSTAIPS